MGTKINTRVLMSGADYFDDKMAINPHMDASKLVNVERAMTDHQNIRSALESAGVSVVKVDPPPYCQDGVYTANWGLCHDNVVIASSLPNKRQDEEPYAREVLAKLGKSIIVVPSGLRFSGQGDALPCGNYLLVGSRYRTSPEVHDFLHDNLDLHVVSLQTVPLKDEHGKDVLNHVTGWPDSFFYDLDLALAVLNEELIAWCPEAFTHESQDVIAKLPLKKIEVMLQEALKGLACNLVSTGETVIMSGHAPLLKTQIEAHGLKVVCPDVQELQKGGGFIRCTTLTI